MRTPRETVLAFIDALTAGAPPEVVGAFFAEHAVSEELPNALFPHGARRDRAAMLAGLTRGRAAVADQTWTVEQVVAEGATVALAFSWRGTMRLSAGPLVEGTTLRARCLGLFEVVDGLITAHRSYDCYEPWA